MKRNTLMPFWFRLLRPGLLYSQYKDHPPYGDFVRSLAVTLLLFSLLVLVSYYIEKVGEWMEALWQAWQTATTIGYGNKPSASDTGRLCYMIVGTLNIAYLPLVFNNFFAVKHYRRELLLGGRMNNPNGEGYVLVNFPGEENALALIAQLRHVEPDVPICIIDNKLEILPKRIAQIPSVHYVWGNMLSRDTYEQAGIAQAKAVVVFPVDRNDVNSDAGTRTATDLILRYLAEKQSSARVLHKLVESASNVMFRGLASVEIGSRTDMLMIVQELQGEHSARVIESILRNDQGEDPHTVSADAFTGHTWLELTRALFRVWEEDGCACKPLALVREVSGGEPEIVASPPRTECIREGDKLVLLIPPEVQWSGVELRLRSALSSYTIPN